MVIGRWVLLLKGGGLGSSVSVRIILRFVVKQEHVPKKAPTIKHLRRSSLVLARQQPTQLLASSVRLRLQVNVRPINFDHKHALQLHAGKERVGTAKPCCPNRNEATMPNDFTAPPPLPATIHRQLSAPSAHLYHSPTSSCQFSRPLVL